MPNNTRKNTAKDELSGAKEDAAPRRSTRRKVAAAETAAAVAAASTKPLKAAGGPMAVGAVAEQAGAATPSAVPALKPLGALGVDEGVFVLLAVPAAFESVESVARYAEEPLPHLMSVAKGSWLKRQSVGGVAVYVSFVPWPQPPAGMVKLGCVTASGRKPVFGVECLRWGGAEPAHVAAMLKRYARLLVPAIGDVLPATHPLRRALAPAPAPAPASVRGVRGHFDGIVDELAHGWAYRPADPDRHLTVEVLCAGEVVARGLANHFRDDLQANGIGNGEHHFRLKLSSELFDGQPHQLSMRIAETGTVLPEQVTATLPHRQPTHVDLMTRAEVITAAHELATKANIRNAKALQTLLQTLRTASLQQETAHFALARQGYESLIKALGPNALCHCRIAETWLLEDEFNLARAAYLAAVDADPAFLRAHWGLGNACRLLGQLEAAQASYRAALALQPNCLGVIARWKSVRAEVLSAQAQQMRYAGNVDQAIALLRLLIIEEPENEQACETLSSLIFQKEQAGIPAEMRQTTEKITRASRLLKVIMDELERRLQLPVAAPVE